MIELSEKQWTRLYKEVSVLAQRRTFTRSQKKQWTARDRAQEAVQRACERMLTTRPASVTSFEEARAYLAGAVRSELWNVGARDVVRMAAETAAVIEEQTLTGGAAASPEQMHLDKAEALREQERAARLVELTRVELGGDRIALATIDCLADEKEAPHEQAAIIGCHVEEVYLARRRRERALERALARYERERDDPREDTS